MAAYGLPIYPPEVITNENGCTLAIGNAPEVTEIYSNINICNIYI